MEVFEAAQRNANLFHENPMNQTAVDLSSSSSSSSSVSIKNIDVSTLDCLAPGYRFEPSDEELITYYLIPKIEDRELEPNMLLDITISDYTPEEIAEKYRPQGEGTWYFFTPRNLKFQKGERQSRLAGDGYWRSSHVSDVYNANGMKIGSKRLLAFHRLGGTSKTMDEKTDWLMYEFTLPSDRKRKRDRENDTAMKPDDYVLCRMYKKGTTHNKKNKGASRRSNENKEIHTLPHVETAPALDTPAVMLPPLPDHPAVQQPARNGSFYGIGSETHNYNGVDVMGNLSPIYNAESFLRGLSSNIYGAVPRQTDLTGLLSNTSDAIFENCYRPLQLEERHQFLQRVEPIYEQSFSPTTATSSTTEFNPQQRNDNDFVLGGIGEIYQLISEFNNYYSTPIGLQLQI